MRRHLLVLTALALLLAAAWPAVAAARNPTPLRLVAESAIGVSSDGERWVILTRRTGPASFAYEVRDTWTGARSRLPEGCLLGGTAESTTMLTAGRALVDCGAGDYAVVDLSGGERTPLPGELVDGDLRMHSAQWYVLGRRWALAEGRCTVPGRDEDESCVGYFDLSTGAARITHPDAPDLPPDRFLDLDAADLPVRRVCRPRLALAEGYSRDTTDTSTRRYAPPYFVGRRGAYRCGDGRLLLRLSIYEAVPDLVGGLLSSGNPLSMRAVARVRVFDLRRRRDHVWTLPMPPGRRRLAGGIVHTRCAVYTATTLDLTEDAYVNEIRVHRARLPGPRCRA